MEADSPNGAPSRRVVIVGLPQNLRSLVLAALGSAELRFLLASGWASTAFRLVQDPADAVATLEGYAEEAPYDAHTLVMWPQCSVPTEVNDVVLALADLGATVLRPTPGSKGWPARAAPPGPTRDRQHVSALCAALDIQRTDQAGRGDDDLFMKERDTVASIIRGLASHNKFGPNNHSSEDDLWSGRGANLRRGEKKKILHLLLTKKRILARKKNKSMGGTGWVYWIGDVDAAVAEFPELEQQLRVATPGAPLPAATNFDNEP